MSEKQTTAMNKLDHHPRCHFVMYGGGSCDCGLRDSDTPRTDGRTHYEGCEKEHHDCALLLIARLRREAGEHSVNLGHARQLSQELAAVRRERDLLRAAAPPLTRDEVIREMEGSVRQHYERAREAERERDMLRADAERYRWLRDTKAYVGVQRHYLHLPVKERTGWTIRFVCGNDDSLDAAIDAARSGEEGK